LAEIAHFQHGVAVRAGREMLRLARGRLVEPLADMPAARNLDETVVHGSALNRSTPGANLSSTAQLALVRNSFVLFV
jgi:hypothetical protein